MCAIYISALGPEYSGSRAYITVGTTYGILHIEMGLQMLQLIHCHMLQIPELKLAVAEYYALQLKLRLDFLLHYLMSNDLRQ